MKDKRLIIIEIPYNIPREEVKELHDMFYLLSSNLTRLGLPKKTKNIKKWKKEAER
jgi:hypothetical protein